MRTNKSIEIPVGVKVDYRFVDLLKTVQVQKKAILAPILNINKSQLYERRTKCVSKDTEDKENILDCTASLSEKSHYMPNILE